jgi:photosystem II stability/assembly factor-like uncharacterized protein
MTLSRFLVTIILIGAAGTAASQESTVYVSVVSTKLFVVGAPNPQTGLFFQHPSADTVWEHTGPKNIRAFGCALGPGESGPALYIAAGNGVHRSTDNGKSWRITTTWKMTEVLWVEPDPRDASVVYAATPYGVFGTSDGCSTWRDLSAGHAGGFTSCVRVDIRDSGRLYCAAEDGAFRSPDRGVTWERMSLHVRGIRAIAQHPSDPRVLIAATEENGIYVSRNGGDWWEKSEAGVDHTTFYTVAFDPSAPDTVYAAGYVTGVYRSVDGGGRWKRMNQGLTDLTFHSLAVDPRDGRRVYGASHGGGIFRTDDAGETWRHVGKAGAQVWHIEIH